MKTLYIIVILFGILAVIYVSSNCFSKGRENLVLEGICSDAAGAGADQKFVGLCSKYQAKCGENSTSVVIHDIAGEYGLNSDMADTMLGKLVNSMNKIGCCNPQNPDDGNCTGNF